MKGIRLRRKARGMTQQQLAEVLEVKRSALAMWETDRSCPPVCMLPRLAATLHCTIEELYGESEKIA